ncbi:MAG TPA: WbqC family protein [Planctomycetota bacterium]|nr:WbqC family protein [Planctomycetota bacterium]
MEVRFHDYTYPVYAQRFGEFVPYLSYLDMLFNVGLQRGSLG